MTQYSPSQASQAAISDELMSSGIRDAVDDPRTPWDNAAQLTDKLYYADLKPAYKFITALWRDDDNKPVIDKFMSNKLCSQLARDPKNPKSAAAFEQYAFQYYFYLIGFLKSMALRFANHTRQGHEEMQEEAQASDKYFEYIQREHVEGVLGDLGIKGYITRTDRSIAEMAYSRYVQEHARKGDWLAMQVVLAASTYRWSKLALELYNDKNTVKEGIFWDQWIIPNVTDRNETISNKPADGKANQ